MKRERVDETPFMRGVMLALGARRSMRIHRQNCGSVPVRDERGRVIRIFDAGPPNGAADISGIVAPEGWRLEIEVKAEGGKRTEAQEAWERMIRCFGGVYAVVEYDGDRTFDENVARAVRVVERAISERRAT